MNALRPRLADDEEKLRDIEQRLHTAASLAKLTDLRTGNAADDAPDGGLAWGADREVQASFLIKLLTGIGCPDSMPPRAVKLRGARITGPLNLEAATIICPVLLQDCYIDEPVNLDQGTGTAIRMPGCHLRGLTAKQLNITGDLILEQAVISSDSEIDLRGAHIGGQLDLSRARLYSFKRQALVADHLIVEQGMSCRALSAEGTISLRHAHISGSLDMGSAHLEPLPRDFARRGERNGQPALEGDSLTVEQDMNCADLIAQGSIQLSSAHIGGELLFGGAGEIVAVEFLQLRALDLRRAEIGRLRLDMDVPPETMVDLSDAKVGRLNDNPIAWPDEIDLRGFTYDFDFSRFFEEKVSTWRRLKWLSLQSGGYVPQVYDQLAAVYQRAGDEKAARKVAIAKQRRRRHPFSPVSWLWFLTVGYGYRPWLAGAWIIALTWFGTKVFSHAYPAHMIATSQHPPTFHAAAYALDLLLPVVGLGEKSAWQPQGTYQYWSWAFTGAGWALTTAVVAGLSGILKRG
jgi:hypothetical protein